MPTVLDANALVMLPVIKVMVLGTSARSLKLPATKRAKCLLRDLKERRKSEGSWFQYSTSGGIFSREISVEVNVCDDCS